MNNLTQLGQSNPFDSIRRLDEHGVEYWSGRELLSLLGKPLKTHHNKLYADDTALLILEAAAITAMDRYYGVSADAHYLWQKAINIYKGQSASFIFHSVATLINNAGVWEQFEVALYPFIQKHWEKIKPFDGELVVVDHACEKKHIPDFFIVNKKLKIPVEVKRSSFSHTDFRQLDRYMKAYDSRSGVAIAPTVSPKTTIPAGVCFVPFSREIIQEIEGYKPISTLLLGRALEFTSRH